MSTTTAFEAKGDVAEWKMVFDAIEHLDHGDEITYERLSHILGRDILENRQPIYDADKHLQRIHGKALVNVKNVGYRIAVPDEAVDIVAARMKRAKRQIRRGRHTSKHAKRQLMSPEALRRLDDLEMRMSRIEEAQRKTAKKVAEHNDAIADVKAALKKHGITV